MKKNIIGRVNEQKVLQAALESPRPEMISVIGRRRVGKTFLIREVYKDYINFELSGAQNATKEEQLRNFAKRLQEVSPPGTIITPPKDWLNAFFTLATYLENLKSDKKLVVFLDELPWLATHKSRFLVGLSWFWNSWAERHHVVLVVCGSAASWMINKILRNKGGLYNRVTKRIHLKPFNLRETETFLNSKNIFLDYYQIVQIYMTMGGIPHYLKELEPGKSAIQNIDKICFSESGLLYNEFESLYPALYDHPEKYIEVIRTLSDKRYGMTRTEIINNSELQNNGKTTRILEELSQSGFISVYYPFGKKRNKKIYRLTDEYSLFYLKFIEQHIDQGENVWLALSQTQQYKIWAGYTYETICLKHIAQIKQALGITSVYSFASTFRHQGNEDEKGVQIDLLLDRNDGIVNLFEIKFSNAAFVINKDYAQRLREKMWTFQSQTKTNKHIFISMLTTFGVKKNMHSLGLIQNDVTMDALFREVMVY